MNETNPATNENELIAQDNVQRLRTLFSDFESGKNTPKLQEMFPEIFDQAGFGRSEFHRFDVLNHSREALKQYHDPAIVAPQFVHYLETQKIEDLDKSTLLELAILFHDAGKRIVKETTGKMSGHEIFTVKNQLDPISLRFGLSQDQTAYIRDLIYFHHVHNETDTDEQIDQSIRDKDVLLGILILRLVDVLSTQGEGVSVKEITSKFNFLTTKTQSIFNNLPHTEQI